MNTQMLCKYPTNVVLTQFEKRIKIFGSDNALELMQHNGDDTKVDVRMIAKNLNNTQRDVVEVRIKLKNQELSFKHT